MMSKNAYNHVHSVTFLYCAQPHSLFHAPPSLFFCRIAVLSQGQSGIFILDPILPLPSQLHALIFLFCINDLSFSTESFPLAYKCNSAYLFLKACYPPFSFSLLPHPLFLLTSQTQSCFYLLLSSLPLFRFGCLSPS